jgi:hypothetical protein
MRRITAFVVVLGLVCASSLAAAGPTALRGAGDGFLVAPHRAGAEICRDTTQSTAGGPEQKIWPFCLDLTCALGGDAGCALYCILTEDINTYGGYCVAGCCYCVRDEDLPPMEN